MALSNNEKNRFNTNEQCEKIISKLRNDVVHILKKKGAVIGISGGIDSSVVFALCVKAFGKDHVLGVLMPDKDSNKESLRIAKSLAMQFDVQYIIEDITEALKGFECYKRRDAAIRNIFPEYNEAYKAKIVLLQDNMEKDALNLYYLKIINPDGEEKTARLPLKEYLQIVAASNFKQRSRMSILYYHAESRNYAVIGTGNKNEHEMGFFVKYGDGGADVKPLVSYYKTEVFEFGRYLNLPEEIINRIPTTDTYSAEQSQEEFFFKVPFNILDKIWILLEDNFTSTEIAGKLNLTPKQVQNVINDILRKKRTTEYLRHEPI
jgi:NAD+ synthase